MTKTVKRIDLAPGQFYEFTVALPAAAPGPLSIHAFDADIVINPGDSLEMIITALNGPLAKAQALALPISETEKKSEAAPVQRSPACPAKLAERSGEGVAG